MDIDLDEIVLKTGAKSPSKVSQMRRSLRNGGKLPEIRVALIDDTLKDRLSRIGLSTEGKKYFMLEGHHRYIATKLEKKAMIAAKVIRKMY